MMQRMLWVSGLLHLALLGGLFIGETLWSRPVTPFGQPVYHVDLVRLPSVAPSKRTQAMDEPYRVVSRKEAAAPEEKAEMALKRTPRLVSEEPDKGPEAPPAFETGTPGVRLDVEAFEFPYYLAAIHRKIQEHFVVPRILGAGYLQTVLYFRIAKDGRVYNLVVEQGSGNPTFDLASQRALESATPLPPLPSEYDRDYLGVHFQFEYRP
jgi:TonB family protein